MLDRDWKALQNGSDIRGIALEGVEGQEINLTDDVVERIGAAFGAWLSEKTNKDPKDLRVSIGTDSRLSASRIKDAAIRGLNLVGIQVFDCGMASTPAMFMTTVTPGYEYNGAIMVTASHLPFNRNGLKFFTREGGLESEDITNILLKAQNKDFTAAQTKGSVSTVDFISVYAKGLVDKVRREVNNPNNYDRPLEGFKIVVDAGNGAGGFYVDKVLVPLGADTTGSQFLEPDGTFPNHQPNPEDKEAMDAIVKAVKENKADFGIIFDADVDRGGAVDSSGREINRNRLVALMAAIVLEKHPGTTIVTDSITSTGLKTFIEDELGGIHHRFKRGYKNVINEAIRLNKEGQECHLAIETSGHGALKENYFLDDGAYLITTILIKMARMKIYENKDISSLIENLAEPAEAKEFRMNLLVEDYSKYGQAILRDLEDHGKKSAGWQLAPDNYEGIRVSFDADNGDGWFLLRMSLHDPLMPLNIEADTPGGVRKIAAKLLPFLEKYEGLDVSPLRKYLNEA